jgi:thiamine biosynthesis protein ThiS
MVIINGTAVDAVGKTISEYLQEANYDKKMIVVEQNGSIISKAQYDNTVINDGDSLEIISFMGGG